MTAQRDPVSVWFDTGARDLLARAYALPRGTWVGTRLADPDPDVRGWLTLMGIDPRGPDNPSVPGSRGGLDCKDRWTRAFVRALFYHHRWHSDDEGLRPGRRLIARRTGSLEVDIGRRMPALGIIPAGRAMRIRIRQGGRNALQAVKRKPDRDRIFAGDGEQGPRSSSLDLRDW